MCTDKVDLWADVIFQRAQNDYKYMIVRDKKYLKWRYQDHPEHKHYFFVVYDWIKRPVGWWLVRIDDENNVLIGDALFCKGTKLAPKVGLIMGLRYLQHKKNIEINQIKGWFSKTPNWWVEHLEKIGFEAEKQFQDLNLCVKSYTKDLDSQQIGKDFYFTHGDSDLF
jgi:hypothetical protein